MKFCTLLKNNFKNFIFQFLHHYPQYNTFIYIYIYIYIDIDIASVLFSSLHYIKGKLDYCD